jgi:HEAT repeat protein
MPPDLPGPGPDREPPRDRLARLAAQVGEARAAELCAGLLAAESPAEHAETLLFLGGAGGRGVLEGTGDWKPYWARVWAARGLLYVWDDAVAPAVLRGQSDPAWRVAEMCLKVAVKRDLGAVAATSALAGDGLPRVRVAAIRALGTGGEHEHLPVVRLGLEDPSEEVRRAAARALERLSARLDLPPPR